MYPVYEEDITKIKLTIKSKIIRDTGGRGEGGVVDWDGGNIFILLNIKDAFVKSAFNIYEYT